MFRVVRKETLHKYISLAQKSDLEIWIPVTSIDREVSKSYRGAVEETGAFSIDPPAIEQLSSYPSVGVKLSVQL